jgi:uncharacterized protein (DUF302 family)
MVDGLVTIESKRGFAETLAAFDSALAARGITPFARIDHAAGAAAAGLTLRPTMLLIFGNPKAGTILMQAVQSTGIDLPLKALVSETASGTVTVAYNDPGWIAKRHGVGVELDPTVQAMRQLLAALAGEAAGA